MTITDKTSGSTDIAPPDGRVRGLRSLRHAAGVAALLLAVPAAVQAAEEAPAPANTVENLVVTAALDNRGVDRDLIGGSVSIITPDDIDQRGARLALDVLRDVPGIAVNRSGCIGCATEIRIRGAEANHTLVLVDGVNLANPVSREVDFSGLLAEDGARIEVLRGQQSALYGSEAIGGVIQYFTPDGRSSPGLHVRGEYGEWNTIDGVLQAGGAKGPADWIVTLSGYHTDGAPDTRNGSRDLGYWNYTASAKAHYAFNDNVRLTAVVRASRARSDFNSATDLTGALIDSAPDHSYLRSLVARVELETSAFDDRWTNSLAVDGGSTKTTSYSFGSAFEEEGDRAKVTWVTAYAWGDSHLKQKLTGSVSYQEERFRQSFDPVRRKLETTGVVGVYDLVLDDNTAFGASVRNDSNNLFESFTSYRVQATHTFSEGTRLRAAAGTGIQYPTQFDLFGFSGQFIANPNLKPEKSEGWELGVEQLWMDKRIRAGLTYFSDRLTDKITSTGFPVSQAINLPGTAHQKGLEAFVEAKLDHGFAVDLAYTYLDSKDGTPPSQTVRRAPNIASANVNWSSQGEVVRLNLNVRYNGDQRDNAFPPAPPFVVPVTLPAFTLVGVNADWNLNERLTLYAHADNLFDERYEEVWSYVSPGRQIVVGAKARF